MTREEIIQAISDDKMMPFIQPEQLAQIVEFVINNYQPFFTSDLDKITIPELEMTEWMKYGPHTNYPWCSVPDAIKITAEHFFTLGKQVGAEWMAGQGEAFDGVVREDGFFVDFDEYGSSMMIPSNTSCFNNAEEVIVQIRKKQ